MVDHSKLKETTEDFYQELSNLIDMNFPYLFKDVALRKIQISDLYDYYKLASNPDVTRYLPDEDIVSSLEEAEQHIHFMMLEIRKNLSIFLAISSFPSNKLIGTIGFNRWNKEERSAFIIYDLIKPYWGKGIMSTVLTYFIKFGFNTMGITTIKAYTMLGNKASQRILEKTGFSNQGTFPFHKPIRNRPVKVYLYSQQIGCL